MKKSTCSFISFFLCAFLLLILSGCGGMSTPGTTPTPPPGTGNGGGSGGGNGGGGGGTPSNLTRQVALISGFVPQLPAPQGSVLLENVDPATGNLSHLPTNIGLLGGGGVTVNPAGTFLVQVEITDIASWAVQSDGSLKQAFKLSPNPVGIPGGTFTDVDHASILMHPSGQFFYYSVFGRGIAGFRLDASGTISQLPGSPFAPDNPLVAMHPSGKFMFADTIIGSSVNGGQGQHAIVTYNIDSSTGNVSVAGQTPVGGAHSRITVKGDHAGKFLFISDDASSAIYTYSVNPSTGSLTLASTMNVAPHSPANLTVNPSDTLLYARAVNNGTQEVLGFSIGADGSLHPVNSGNPVLTGNPVGLHIAVDLTGKFFYSVVFQQSGDQVFGFRINSDGSLSPNSTTTLSTSNPLEVSGINFVNFKQ